MFRKKQQNIFGVLDIGSEAVKFLIIEKKDNKKIILGKALKPYNLFSVFDSGDFEVDVLKKTIKEAVQEAESQANSRVHPVRLAKPLSNGVKNLIVGLSPHILKADIFSQKFIRKEPELKIDKKEKAVILNEIDRKLKKDILSKDIAVLSKKLIEIKMNGYKISELVGFRGENLDITIFVTFLARRYLKNIKEIIQGLGFQIVDIVHEAEGIMTGLKKNADGLFINIGGDFTQIFLIEDNILARVLEFECGGRNFSNALSKNFSILYNEAEKLVDNYQKNNLEEPLKARIKKIFQDEAKTWFSFLEKELSSNSNVFSNIFCFGGGSNLLEIKEILEENYCLPVKEIDLKDFSGIEDRIKITNNNYYIPAILLAQTI